MRLGTVILIGVYMLLELSLGFVYPEKATDYSVWLEYWNTKTKVYEVMFCAFFFLLIKTKAKYFAIFGFCISFASAFDKVILSINSYLYSDILIIIMALAISIYIYGRDKRRV